MAEVRAMRQCVERPGGEPRSVSLLCKNNHSESKAERQPGWAWETSLGLSPGAREGVNTRFSAPSPILESPRPAEKFRPGFPRVR